MRGGIENGIKADALSVSRFAANFCSVEAGALVLPYLRLTRYAESGGDCIHTEKQLRQERLGIRFLPLPL